jgi:hypothetical protein
VLIGNCTAGCRTNIRIVGLLAFALLFVSVACSSTNESAIATAVSGTTEAQQVAQVEPSSTPEPVSTATPEPTPTPTVEPLCVDTALDYLVAAEDLLTRWEDAVAIADSTGRIALAGPVGELQAIQRDLGNLEPPKCTDIAHTAAIDMMEHTIDGFLLFMQEKSDSQVSAALDKAFAAANLHEQAIREIISEVPEPLEDSSNPFVQQRIAADPYLVFQQVQHDCFACGRDSLAGFWIAADGSDFTFDANGTYASESKGETLGRWEIDGEQLCLTSSNDVQACYPFEKRVDAMLFDGVIYLRY